MTAWPRPPRLAPHKSTSIPMHAMCLWIYDFDLFRMRPAHLLVNSSPPCTDWLAPSRERKWPPSHVWYSCRPLRWKARRVWFLAACPEHFCLSNQLQWRDSPSSVSELLFLFFFISLELLLTPPLCYLCITWNLARRLQIWGDGMFYAPRRPGRPFSFPLCARGANLLWKPCRHLDILHSLSRALTPPSLMNMWWITSDMWF